MLIFYLLSTAFGIPQKNNKNQSSFRLKLLSIAMAIMGGLKEVILYSLLTHKEEIISKI